METDLQIETKGNNVKNQVLIGSLLLALGALLILLKTCQTKTERAIEKPEEKKEPVISDKEKEEMAAKVLAERNTYLATLQIPDNFPKEIPIYFGSQTGTAEKFCNMLAEEAHELGIKGNVIDLDNFEGEKFVDEELVLAVIATHYEGEPCDNTKHFHKWIRQEVKAKNVTRLNKLKFGIMGLGDSSYEQFNAMATFFDEKFKSLGGERLVETGMADADKNTTEQDFDTWKTNLWSNLIEYYKAKQPAGATSQKSSAPIRKKVKSDPSVMPFKIVEEGATGVVTLTPGNCADQGITFDMNAKHYMKSFDCKVSKISELRQKPGVGGSTIECIFALPQGVSYKTAANSAIFAPNQAEYIQKFSEQHQLNLDHKFKIAKNEEFQGHAGNLSLPIIKESITIKEFLTTFLDLQSALTKKQLTALATFCTDATQKEEMTRIAASKDDYQKQILDKNIGLVDLQDKFKSLKLNLDVLVNKCEMIRPRYYTIASSSVFAPNLLTVALSVEKFESPDGQRTGLVSKYLQDIFEGKSTLSCKIFVKESNFGMPPSDAQPAPPMLMVGPGTGIVPFIGFLQELSITSSVEGNGPEAHMYFGCRDEGTDFIYRDFMADMLDKKVLTKLNTAFSRAQDGSPKTYVQDVLRKQGAFLVEMLTKRNAYFYICGNNKMGLDVQNLIRELVGDDYYQQIKDEKRIRLETWS